MKALGIISALGGIACLTLAILAYVNDEIGLTFVVVPTMIAIAMVLTYFWLSRASRILREVKEREEAIHKQVRKQQEQLHAEDMARLISKVSIKMSWFYSPQEIDTWMETANPYLDNKSPKEILEDYDYLEERGMIEFAMENAAVLKGYKAPARLDS